MRTTWVAGARAAGLTAAIVLHSGGAWADARLRTQVITTFEAITLRIDADRLDYSGTAEFELDVREHTDNFNFRAEGMTIDELTLTLGDRPVPTEFSMKDYGIVEVRAGSALGSGPVRLAVAFSTSLDTTSNSLYRASDAI